MSDLATRAQVEILATILHTEPTELAFLERFSLEQVAQLVSAVSDDVFDELGGMFRRVSRLAPLVPNPLVASVAQAKLPPLVAGRAAGALGVDHPDRITDVLSRIKPEYMADCAPYLDPRAVKVVAPRISADLILPAARILLERGEYAVAARFVEYATPELVIGFEKGLDDDAGLLRTAALVVDEQRLAEIIRSMPERRVERIVRGALADDDLISTALSLLARLDTELRARYGPLLLAEPGQEAVGRITRLAAQHGALAELGAIISALPPDSLAELMAGLPEETVTEVRSHLPPRPA